MDPPITRGMTGSRGRLMIDHFYHPDEALFPIQCNGWLAQRAGIEEPFNPAKQDLRFDKLQSRLGEIRP